MNFKLPEKERTELAAIFTEQSIPAIEQACRWYLHEMEEPKVSIIEDGKTLLTIAKKAEELQRLLRTSKSTRGRLSIPLQEFFRNDESGHFLGDLDHNLETLVKVIEYMTPEAEQARTPKQGRPRGSKNYAARSFAFMLWEAYRQAHGKPPGRVWNEYEGAETGPMVETIEILRTLLPIGEKEMRFSRYFREITEDYYQKLMDINLKAE